MKVLCLGSKKLGHQEMIDFPDYLNMSFISLNCYYFIGD